MFIDTKGLIHPEDKQNLARAYILLALYKNAFYQAKKIESNAGVMDAQEQINELIVRRSSSLNFNTLVLNQEYPGINFGIDLSNPNGFESEKYDGLYGEGSAQLCIDQLKQNLEFKKLIARKTLVALYEQAAYAGQTPADIDEERYAAAMSFIDRNFISSDNNPGMDILQITLGTNNPEVELHVNLNDPFNVDYSAFEGLYGIEAGSAVRIKLGLEEKVIQQAENAVSQSLSTRIKEIRKTLSNLSPIGSGFYVRTGNTSPVQSDPLLSPYSSSLSGYNNSLNSSGTTSPLNSTMSRSPSPNTSMSRPTSPFSPISFTLFSKQKSDKSTDLTIATDMQAPNPPTRRNSFFRKKKE